MRTGFVPTGKKRARSAQKELSNPLERWTNGRDRNMVVNVEDVTISVTVFLTGTRRISVGYIFQGLDVYMMERQMKVGDLVIRKLCNEPDWKEHVAINQRELLGPGIILSKQMGGSNPSHPCVTVLYPSVEKVYDIAESLVEVISELH
jgi:hypothetical protein